MILSAFYLTSQELEILKTTDLHRQPNGIMHFEGMDEDSYEENTYWVDFGGKLFEGCWDEIASMYYFRLHYTPMGS